MSNICLAPTSLSYRIESVLSSLVSIILGLGHTLLKKFLETARGASSPGGNASPINGPKGDI